MFPSFLSSARKKRDDYLANEAELIKLASSQFTAEDAQRSSISAFDTLIPSIHPTTTHRCYCQVDGWCDQYKIHGIRVQSPQTDDQTKKKETTPLVLLHGYGNSSSYFFRTWAPLSKHFTKVYTLDLFGFGASSRPVFWPTTAADAEDFFVNSLEAWRIAMGVESMILVGHSLGGYLSVAYAERYPQHVHNMCLLSPIGVPHETEEILKSRRQRRNASIASLVVYIMMRLVYTYISFGDFLRWMPKIILYKWVLPDYANRFAACMDSKERWLVTMAGYTAALLPPSGELCILHILKNTHAYARKPLVDRIPQLLRGPLQSCYFFYGESDWMDAGGGLGVKRQSGASVRVYRVQNAGHMLLLENPTVCVNGLVHCLFPAGQLASDDPLPVALES